jgi:hypothetical protein
MKIKGKHMAKQALYDVILKGGPSDGRELQCARELIERGYMHVAVPNTVSYFDKFSDSAKIPPIPCAIYERTMHGRPWVWVYKTTVGIH